MKKNVKLIISIILVLLIIFAFLAFGFFKTIDSKKNITNKNVLQIIHDNKNVVIYIADHKNKKYNEIKNILDTNKIDYYLYDINNKSKSESNELIQNLGISPTDFGFPAIVYIKEGTLYSDVINISDVKDVKNFIEEYNLKAISKEW